MGRCRRLPRDDLSEKGQQLEGHDDLDKDATSINMALTVGGNAIEAGSLDCKSARGVHLYLHPYGSRLETDG